MGECGGSDRSACMLWPAGRTKRRGRRAGPSRLEDRTGAAHSTAAPWPRRMHRLTPDTGYRLSWLGGPVRSAPSAERPNGRPAGSGCKRASCRRLAAVVAAPALRPSSPSTYTTKSNQGRILLNLHLRKQSALTQHKFLSKNEFSPKNKDTESAGTVRLAALTKGDFAGTKRQGITIHDIRCTKGLDIRLISGCWIRSETWQF